MDLRGGILNPEYYNNKNIIKYLEKNFGKVNAKSDTSINSFKRSIKHRYRKERLQEIHRKITLHNLRMELSSDMNMIYLAFGSFLAGVITLFITYITIKINQIHFLADKSLSIKITEEHSLEDKEKVLDEIMKALSVAIDDMISIGLKYLIIFFVFLMISAVTIAILQTKKMYKRRLYKVIIEDCIEES